MISFQAYVNFNECKYLPAISERGRLALKSFGIGLLSAILIVFLCEMQHRHSVRETLGWAVRDFGNMLKNVALLALLQSLSVCFCDYLSVSFAIFFVIFYIISFVSYSKYAARNEPLYASDILLTFKVSAVADSSNVRISVYTIGGLVAGVLWGLVISPHKINDTPFVFKAGILAVLMLIIVLMLYGYYTMEKPDYTYRRSGLALGFICNVLHFIFKQKPERYDALTVKAAAARHITEDKPQEPATVPDIVMVLSESFWDPTRLPLLRLSYDPIPFFHKMQSEYLHGDIVVTPYGGGTCNVESEVLLGVCNRHFDISCSFYHSFIKNTPVESLPRFLGSRGYRSTAVHTFDSKFYDRDRAFTMMGFESFRGIEHVNNPRYCGRYASDLQLYDMILEEMESDAAHKFVFGISMENHQPYNKHKYRAEELTNIRILNEELSEAEKECLEAYVTGVNHADKLLSLLVEHFSKVEKPTIVLFFGDHLGALGWELGLYQKLGMINDRRNLTQEDIVRLYSPPFVLWSNYDNPCAPVGDVGRIGANNLGNVLLDSAGLHGHKPEIYRMLDAIRTQMRCITRNDVFIDASGNLLKDMPESFMPLEKAYRMCEYKNLGIQ